LRADDGDVAWRRRPPWADVAAVVFATVFPTLAAWLYFVAFAGQGPAMRLVFAGSKVFQACFPVLWLGAVRRQRLRPGPASSRGLVIGLAFGLVVLAATYASYELYLKRSQYLGGAAPAIGGKLAEIGIDTPAAFLATALFISVVHSLFEEYYWRWFVFGQLRRWLGLWPAVVLSGIGFALHHVVVLAVYIGPEHFWTAVLTLSAAVALGGMFWAWLYARSGSLLGPWLGHLLVDAGLMWIGFDLCREVLAS
jgi:hypothetical protein